MKDNYVIGRNPVMEILKSDREIDKIYIQQGDLKGSIKKILGRARSKNIVVQEVDRQRLDQIAEGGVHQGVAALVSPFKYSSLDQVLSYAESRKEDPFLLILDGIEDPHNLGAIIRTAECAGAHGVVIPERRAAQVNQTVAKSSAGAIEHMKVVKVVNISDTIDYLKDRGLWIYGADAKGDTYFKTDLGGSLALVIGSEGKGISRLVKEKCDFLLSIPMYGEISSLNASNATSVLIYEVVRQNYGKAR